MSTAYPSPGLVRRSPLEGRAASFAAAGSAATARIAELPFLGQLDVRLDPTDDEALARVAAVVGVALPQTADTVASAWDRHALWLGPDEWLIVAPDGAAAELERGLRDALAGHERGAVVDVSANRTTLVLAGPRAREVLESGCGIDLHPRAFGAGRCAQTLVARANAIVWQTLPEPQPEYRLLVRPSFAGYLADWLLDALDGLD